VLELIGTGFLFYAYEDAGNSWTPYANPIPLNTTDENGHWVYIKSCEQDPCKTGDAAYTQVSFYKSGNDNGGLTGINVSYDDPLEGKILLSPDVKPVFSQKSLQYKVVLRQDKDFTIEVVTRHGYTMGIEWIDWQGQLGATWLQDNGGEFTSCRDLLDPICDERHGLKCRPPQGEEGHRVSKFHMKGFTTPRKGGIISVCGVGNDAARSRTNYTLEVEVVKAYSHLLENITWSYAGSLGHGPHAKKILMYPALEEDRIGFTEGSFDPLISEWEIMLPEVADPGDRVAVEGPDKPPLVVTAVAVENNASIKAKIQICDLEEPDCKHKVDKEGQAEYVVYMRSNETRDVVRDAPELERTLVIDVTAPDNLDHHSRYRVIIKQNVSRRAILSYIDFSDTPCEKDLGSILDFDPDQEDYKCAWSWDNNPDDSMAVVTPSFDEHECPGCELEVLDPHTLEKEDTLFMDFMDARTQQNPDLWTYEFPSSKRKWTHKFLPGESHVVPFYVIAADHSTRKEYRIEFSYTCPFLRSAKFARYVSNFVSWTALLLATGIAGYFIAAILRRRHDGYELPGIRQLHQVAEFPSMQRLRQTLVKDGYATTSPSGRNPWSMTLAVDYTLRKSTPRGTP
jgi:hypothetical protein